MKENILLFLKCKIPLAKVPRSGKTDTACPIPGDEEGKLYHCTGMASGNRTPQFTCAGPVPIEGNETWATALMARKFTISNKPRRNGLVHETRANQLVSILQKRNPQDSPFRTRSAWRAFRRITIKQAK
jgi:hypothetical protein